MAPRPPGRPPKPIEAHRRAGNPSKKRLPEPGAVIVLASRPPRAPSSLQKAGRHLWRLIWTEAAAWIAPSDTPLLVMLCEAADERSELRALIATHGRTFTTEKGYVQVRPEVQQLRALEALVTTWCSMFGLSPSDRARLGLAEVRRVTHLEDLRSRREQSLGR